MLMPNYYVNENAQSDGYHEVHIDDESCSAPPRLENRRALGWHVDCQSAVKEAKTIYSNSDGCAHCVPGCHTR